MHSVIPMLRIMLLTTMLLVTGVALLPEASASCEPLTNPSEPSARRMHPGHPVELPLCGDNVASFVGDFVALE